MLRFFLFVGFTVVFSGCAGTSRTVKPVLAFYEQTFNQHQPKEAAQKYLSETYIQHNPNVATGRQAFIDFFVPFFAANPKASAQIMRVIADKDLVALHVHAKMNPEDKGLAIVDIFRVENGTIVEHWDVIQAIPNVAANNNTMF